MASRRVIIHSNENRGEGKIIVFKGNNFSAFKKEAGKKLGLNVKRVFLNNGVEVKKLDELLNDDILYCSEGGAFYSDMGGKSFQVFDAFPAELASPSITLAANSVSMRR